jgi:hypothetical protein
MRGRANDPDPGAELEVRIIWRQWHDGRWEAWVTDESGRPPHLIRDRVQLEQFLSQAYQHHSRDAHRRSDSDDR